MHFQYYMTIFFTSFPHAVTTRILITTNVQAKGLLEFFPNKIVAINSAYE